MYNKNTMFKRKHILKGVNLGGWLVIEKWITPSLFINTDSEDEYNLHKSRNSEIIQNHYDSFITESDFKTLSEYKYNSVRIPIGYWLFGDIPPYPKTVQYLDRAMEWAQKYSIKVILDLHALPGSQNGFDHSGRVGDINWHKDSKNIESSLEVLENISERYKEFDNLFGIELINEPSIEIPIEILKDYYLRSYEVVRKICKPNVAVIFSDSFRPYEWKDFIGNPRFENVYLDIHFYQCFDQNSKHLSINDTIKKAKREWGRTIKDVGKYANIICGEWSMALNSVYPSEYENKLVSELIYKYAKVQRKIFRHIYGDFFWTYKTDGMSKGAFVWNLSSSLNRDSRNT